MNNHASHQNGFTIIEILVTLVVTALFITLFFEMFTTLGTANTVTRNQTLANDTAYSMLKKYTALDATPNNWFTCDANTNDLVVNSSAPGTIVESGSLTRQATGISEPISYTVTALAIYGCAGANIEKPIRVQITLTYGPHNDTVTHAVLVGY